MTTQPGTRAQRSLSPLLYPAITLSLGSLAWTTWSLVDLLGAGPIGLTVAAGADVIWGAVIFAEARGLRVGGRPWIVHAFGWFTLAIVAGFLTWHGINEHSYAMAAAGPFLPFGAKAVWALALADMRDPASLTHEERATLAELQRRMVFEEEQHRIEMRRRTMGAELVMREVSTDFDIEVMRQDRSRELHRMRPFELDGAPHHAAEAPRIEAPRREALPPASPVEAPHGEAHQHEALPASPPRDAHRIAVRRTDAPQPEAPHTTASPDGAPATEAPRTTTVASRIEAPKRITATVAPKPTPKPEPEAVPASGVQLDGLSMAAATRVLRKQHPTETAQQIADLLIAAGYEQATAAKVRTIDSRTRAAS